MKSFMILSCVILCIGYIQAYSVPPERPFGHPPPLWDESISLEDVQMEDSTEGPEGSENLTTERPEVEEESNENSNEETIIRVEAKPDNATLVKMCIEMFVTGQIEIPNSMATMEATSTTDQPTTTSPSASTSGTTTESKAETTTMADDVKMTTGTVENKTMTTVSTVTTTKATGPALLFSCNFEYGWCGIEQDTSYDQFNWTLADYPTPSSMTGPDRAYSGTHYIFIEATGQKHNDDAAILLPELAMDNSEGGDEACLQFKYHMYGFHVQQLMAYMERSHGPMKSRWELASISGEQGNQWHHTQINFYATAGDRVGFLGTRGLGYSGDIALDDIVVTSGFCNNDVTNSTQSNQVTTPTQNNEVH